MAYKSMDLKEDKMKITIIGAGIAGLSSAIFLKEEGFEVQVYEKNKSISDIGAGIVCWPNASFVLHKLGLLEKVSKASGKIAFMKRFNQKGEVLSYMDINKLNEKMNFSSYSILRKDLMGILYEKSKDLNIAMKFNHKLISINYLNEKQMQLIFSNGEKLYSNFIVGADGRMNSLTRKYVHRNNKPVFQGFINWVGLIESKSEIFSPLDVLDYWGDKKRFGIVPINNKKAYWAAGMSCDMIEKKDPSLYKKELINHFKTWPSSILNIINKTSIEDINKIYIHDHNPINIWHKNSVLLIGDCAHAALPTSGQGACQALEDAWHLCQSLIKNKNNIENTCIDFYKVRKNKTAFITSQGRELAQEIFDNDDQDFCAQRAEQSKNSIDVDNTKGIADFWSMDLPLSR